MNIDRNRLKNYDDNDAPSVGAPLLPPAPDTRRPVAASFSRPSALNTDVAPPQQPAPLLRPEPPRPQPQPTPVQRPLTRPDPVQQPLPTHQSTAPQPAVPSTNVTINISMPKLKKPTLPNWPYKRIAIIAGIVVALIIVSIIVHALVAAAIEHRRVYKLQHQLTTTQKITKPTYKPLVPASKQEAVAKTAAFDATRDSYSYTDTLKGTSLVISQQPLTGANTTATVAKVAKSLNATTVVALSGGAAYMASDKVTGAQTLVMGKNGLLVFVQSAFAHSTQDWQSYLDGLST